MSDPTYPLFPIFTFLGFLLSLIPLPWHLYAWNSGTCYYMLWASLACLNQFVNSIVWARNALNPSPIWCEISIRIMLGASVGLPASSLCINRRLYQIANVQTVTTTHSERRRAVLIDTLICVVFPLIFTALQYVVQGHRFNIFEDIGCYPALYNTLLTYFISSMWPIILGLISACYCGLTLFAFSSRRAQFAQFLSSNTSLTVSRYFRLMALAMTEIILTTPLAIFTIWLNATATPIGPWRSWDDTHFHYSRVEQIPALLWRQNRLLVIAFEFTRWVTPLCALIFFAFFGFADEAKRNYRRAMNAVLKSIGYTPVSSSARSVPSLGRFQKSKTSFATESSTPTYTSPKAGACVPLHDLKRTTSTTSTTPTLDGRSYHDKSSPSWSPKDDISFCSTPTEKKFINDMA